MPLNVLIADDHAIVREGLTSVINRQADMRVIGQATNGQEAIALALALRPDVILLDLMMPIKDGLEAIREIKAATHDQLLQAIRDVAQGRASLHPAIALKVMREIDKPAPDLPPTPDPLTAREMDTLRLIARGLTNQEIAAELSLHERTVVKYVTNIFEKLHLANRTQAALYALRQGIADL